MEFRFNKSKGLYPVPTVLCSDIYTGQLDDLVNMYKEWLPNHEVGDQDIRIWKACYDKLTGDKRPSTLASAIK